MLKCSDEIPPEVVHFWKSILEVAWFDYARALQNTYLLLSPSSYLSYTQVMYLYNTHRFLLYKDSHGTYWMFIEQYISKETFCFPYVLLYIDILWTLSHVFRSWFIRFWFMRISAHISGRKESANFILRSLIRYLLFRIKQFKTYCATIFSLDLEVNLSW